MHAFKQVSVGKRTSVDACTSLQDLQAIMGWIIMCAGNLPIEFESSNIQLGGGWTFSEGIISRSSGNRSQECKPSPRFEFINPACTFLALTTSTNLLAITTINCCLLKHRHPFISALHHSLLHHYSLKCRLKPLPLWSVPPWSTKWLPHLFKLVHLAFLLAYTIKAARSSTITMPSTIVPNDVNSVEEADVHRTLNQ